MTFRTQTLTILPALFFFGFSSYLALYTFQVVNPSTRQELLALASSLFVGGIVLTLHWGYYWAVSKGLRESKSGDLSGGPSFGRVISLSLIAMGVITLAWVGQLALHDRIRWGKDVTCIFFSSRTAEYLFPTLGIDMRVIHYFLIGLALLLFGLAVFVRTRGCPHNFGYWANQPKKATMPKKCITCPKAAECVSGTRQEQEKMPKPAAKKEKDFSECPHHLGYLRSLPGSEAVPHECKTCPDLLECKNLI